MMTVRATPRTRRLDAASPFAKNWTRNKYIYLMLLPIVVYYGIFHYVPMGGAVIAFQEYSPARGFWGSRWIGFTNFTEFLSGRYAWRLIRNTVLLNVYQIIFGFPAPIILALLINEMKANFYKKSVQTISYMPHFISIVVVAGMIVDFSRSGGLFNDAIAFLGGERTSLLARSELFRTIFVGSEVWQRMGWGSIIYLATLSTVDPNLQEAAVIDGASRLQRMIHISFAAIVPVIVIMLIMRVGNIMTQGFEKIILLYSPVTYETADVLSSYVYRRGLVQMDFSFGAAVGIFNSLVNLTILYAANSISRRLSAESLW